jgi:hypothetical protein
MTKPATPPAPTTVKLQKKTLGATPTPYSPPPKKPVPKPVPNPK